MPAPKIEKVERPRTIHDRIMVVQQAVGFVAKMGFNDFHKYKYAKEADYLEELKPYLGENGLAIESTMLEYVEKDVQTTKEKTENRIYAKMRFSIVDVVNGEKVEADFYGVGQDAGDKAMPKAITMATKYFVHKFFLIPTSDDAEQDNRKPEKAKAGPAPKVDPADNKGNFEKAKMMMKRLDSPAAIFESLEKLKTSTNFNAEQKKELNTILSVRLDEIQNQQPTTARKAP